MSYLTEVFIGVISGLVAGMILRLAQLVSERYKGNKHRWIPWWIEVVVTLILFIIFSVVVLHIN